MRTSFRFGASNITAFNVNNHGTGVRLEIVGNNLHLSKGSLGQPHVSSAASSMCSSDDLPEGSLAYADLKPSEARALASAILSAATEAKQ